MPKSALYFLDFYNPNDGELDTALEVGVLRWDQKEERPSVYLHTFLRPQNPSRVRWANALDHGISRKLIMDGNFPTLQEVLNCNFLRDKQVVCLNPGIEPCRSFVRKAISVQGIVNTWQEVFRQNEDIAKLIRPSQMLEYLGLPVKDESNTRYTPLLCRLHSLVAIWFFLSLYKNNPQSLKQGGLPITTLWPLPSVSDVWFENNPQSFKEISPAAIKRFFSDGLADNLNWYALSVFSHDWVFKRQSLPDIAHLKNLDAMADFVFNRVLNLQMKLWVLIYYSIYDKKVKYAQEIALHEGNILSMPQAIREDFTAFFIRHLEDFLSTDQKRQLIRSMVHHYLKERAEEHFESYNYDALYRHNSKDRLSPLMFRSDSPQGSFVKCFKEIKKGNNQILYRRYEISGNRHDRQCCIDRINELFNHFMREVHDPLSCYWSNAPLRQWIQYITGIPWDEYAKIPRPNDPQYLLASRAFLKQVILEERTPWLDELKSTMMKVVEEINAAIDGTYCRQFTFQGISIEVVVSKEQGSFFKRLAHMFNRG
ncbi:hypothetical protein [uncultured Succinatimonas sp.]|uniref:hypothetical protein n=1 Tax=uncultured Succinatimonas sp. TaxID=1262973 RepID=UPI0025D98DF5|nr:hypothetical protein [uncultured Succinatimonas sp.]